MTKEKNERFLQFCRENDFDISDENSNQRKAVLGNSYSVLPAGAGSGKTTVLTYRFLRLIADEEEDIHSDEILTITFTKAATANMRAKIYLILKKAVTYSLIDEEELTRFSNAEISTTDSFCSKIVRLDSARYGISSSFSIEDENDYRDFIEKTLREIIEEKTGKEKEVERLCTLLSFDTLCSAYTLLASSYINIATPFTNDEKEMASLMKKEAISIITEETEKRKEELKAAIAEFIEDYRGCSSVSADTEHARHIMSFLIEGKKIPEESSFTQKRTVKEKPDKNEDFRKQRKYIRDSFGSYLEGLGYTDETMYGLVDAYASVLTSFQERILEHKRKEGLLTFHDVTLLSIDILKTNPVLRAYYNGRFKKIMVDEFQDNNEENKRLLYLLAAKPEYRETGRYPDTEDIILSKVFMVGDEKQSIYRFRGADVSVFKNIRNDFGDERVLALSENFRSENYLIKKINSIFAGRIIPEHSEREYEAEYTPLSSRRERVKPEISFRYMNAKSISEDIDRRLLAPNALCEAYEVARIIREEILTGEKSRYRVYDTKTKEIRSPRPSDIAILLRNGSNQSSFEKALRHFGIPFTVTDNKSLTMDAVLNDFYSILQYSVYGDDDPLTYACLLRSPFVNMNDNDLEKTVLGKKDEISADGKRRLEELERMLSMLKEKEKTESLTAVMHYLWFDCGYRFFIETEKNNESYGEHYDYLFTIAADYDRNEKGIVELLERIRPSLGTISNFKDLTVQREKTEGVTIQTIHKSKGLEYPVVFISDMGVRPRNETFPVTTLPSGLPFFKCFLNEDGELVNPVSIIRKEDENRIENAETKRILYVAATRSIHHLIFTAVFGKKSISRDGRISPSSDSSRNTMLQYLVDGLGFELSETIHAIDTKEFKPVYRSVFNDRNNPEEKDRTAIEKWYSDPIKPKEQNVKMRLGVTTLIRDESIRTENTAVLPQLGADRILNHVQNAEVLTEEEIKGEREKRIQLFGTLVHLFLENAVKGVETDTSSFFRNDGRRAEIIQDAIKLKDNFLSSPFYKSLEGCFLYPEKEFFIKDGEMIVEGIMDLLCVSEEKAIIVDYKSDAAKAPERHRAQLGYYRKALGTI